MAGISLMILLIIFIVVMALCFVLGRGMRKKNIMQTHPRVVKCITLGYVAFAACFTFPLRSEPFPFDLDKAYMVIGSCGIIGLLLMMVYGKHKEKVVYPLTLAFTAIGMVCRYILEFGEVSNTYNFTAVNVISYLVIIPAAVTIVYLLVGKERRGCNNEKNT